MSETKTTGRVVFIGAGPGDPELLTLKAARLIAEIERSSSRNALILDDVDRYSPRDLGRITSYNVCYTKLLRPH